MKKILLIITGSIAASKCENIINLFNNNKIEATCILTEEAKKYIRTSKIKKLLLNRIFTDKSEKKNSLQIHPGVLQLVSLKTRNHVQCQHY